MQRWFVLGSALLVGALAWPSGVHAEEGPAKTPVRVETRFQNSPGKEQYPKAKAIILEDFIGFEAESDGSNTFTEHDVVKVLNPQGVEEHADLLRTYIAGQEEVKVTRARTITPDGSVVEISPDQVKDEPLMDGVKLYQGYRKVVLHYPQVTPNSIVEYDIVTHKKPQADKAWWATTYVQNPDPILISTFTVKVPTGTALHWSSPGVSGEPQRTQDGDKDRYYWEVKNSPAQDSEPSMPSSLDTMHRIEVSSFASWPEVRGWLERGWDAQVRAGEKVSVLTAGLLPPQGTPRQKAEALCAWLSKNKTSIDLPVEQTLPHPPADAVDMPTLSLLDTAGLASAMFSFAGLQVTVWPAFTVPVEAIKTDLPRPNRVEGVMLQLHSGSDEWWVDPQHPGELLAKPPSGYQGMAALSPEGQLRTLPTSMADDNRQEMSVESYVGQDGRAEVLINLRQTGDSGVIWREAGRELAESPRESREQTLDRLFGKMARAFSPRARVHDHYFALAPKPGEPFDMSTTLIVPGYATGEGGPPSGATNLTCPLPIQPNEKVAPLVSDAPRQQPIHFAHPFREDTQVHVVLPPGSEVQASPTPVEVNTPYGQFYATTRIQGSEVWYYSRLVVTSTWIPLDATGEFLKLARAVVTSHGSQISFTPPATPAKADTKAKDPGAKD